MGLMCQLGRITNYVIMTNDEGPWSLQQLFCDLSLFCEKLFFTTRIRRDWKVMFSNCLSVHRVGVTVWSLSVWCPSKTKPPNSDANPYRTDPPCCGALYRLTIQSGFRQGTPRAPPPRCTVGFHTVFPPIVIT